MTLLDPGTPIQEARECGTRSDWHFPEETSNSTLMASTVIGLSSLHAAPVFRPILGV